MNKLNNKGTFESFWGIEVTKGGFLQLPHDFYRNIGELNISPTDTLVAIYIIGQEQNAYISARTIATALGVSVGTVRKSFRTLHKRKLIHRIYRKGEANRFSYKGLRSVIREYAKLKYTSRQNIPIGVRKKPNTFIQNQYTNKEQIINNEDTSEGERRYYEARKNLGL